MRINIRIIMPIAMNLIEVIFSMRTFIRLNLKFLVSHGTRLVSHLHV